MSFSILLAVFFLISAHSMAFFDTVSYFSMLYKDGEYVITIEKLLVGADIISNEILHKQVTIVSSIYPFEVMVYGLDGDREKVVLCMEKVINSLMFKSNQDIQSDQVRPKHVYH